MAAISALMIDEGTLQKEKSNGPNSPITAQPSVRVRSPKQSDIAIITNPEPEPSDVCMTGNAGAVQPPRGSVDATTQTPIRHENKRPAPMLWEVETALKSKKNRMMMASRAREDLPRARRRVRNSFARGILHVI